MNFGGQSRVACICINKCDKAALGTPKMPNALCIFCVVFLFLLFVVVAAATGSGTGAVAEVK